MKKLYVGNLPYQVSEAELENWFTQAGVTGTDPGSTIVVVSGPTRGTVTGSTTAALTYTPTSDTAGVDTFTYYIQTSTGVKSVTKSLRYASMLFG